MTALFRLQRGVLVLVVASLVAVATRADPLITEFMATNVKALPDGDGEFSDWIEIHNPDAAAVNLEGWYLTDDAKDKKKWQFPAVSVPAGGYLVVFASGKNRRDPAAPLHTNFALNGSGEYLGLVKPDGVAVASEFAPEFPNQRDDISYGVTQPTAAGETVRTGYFRAPTPGARNGGADALLVVERPAFSRAAGPFTGAFNLTVSGGFGGQRIRYVLAAPSEAGATAAAPTADSPEYTAPLAITTSVLVRAALFSADNTQRGPTATAHYVRLATAGAARLDSFSSQLPLLVIDTHGTGPFAKDGLERPAWLYTWERGAAGGASSLTAPPTAASALTTNVRGASSSDFPKKGYTLKLNDTGGNPGALSLFGLSAFDHWDIIAAWSYDRSYLHNAFIYALSNRIGRWAPRTQFVEVFFNSGGDDLDYNDYTGIYIFTESLRVDPKRVALTPLSPGDTGPRSITGGYFFKIDLPDADEFSFQTTRDFPGLPFALTVISPKAADLSKAQREYFQGHVQAFEDALYADRNAGFQQRTHLDYIDRPAWIDHHILNVLSSNADAFQRSAYMTKDRNGRIAAGPAWDFDRSMHGGDHRSVDPAVWNGSGNATELWVYGWWGLLARDPEFVQAWIDRWHQLRQREFSVESLHALVDTLAAQIGTAAAARDAVRWANDAEGYGNTPRFPGGWQDEVLNLKLWLTQRVEWIDSQFTAPSTVALANGTITVRPAAGTQVAYTTDGTDPRAFGGRTALAARFSSAPVTFPESTDLQVRGYRANADLTVVPASQWSAPLGGPKSSPILPRPRLSNLSSRGFVGTGENIMITGVVVSDTAGKEYLARAVGPTLASFGLGGALATPVLTILDKDGKEIARNSDWQRGAGTDDVPDVSATVGAFALGKNNKDAALVTKLPYGNYTLQISSGDTGTGVALAELYELNAETGRTLNLSTRGVVRAGEGLLIGGVVVRGPGPKRLLVRAIGPALADFGVGATLPDPVLEIFSGSTSIATNDNWDSTAGTVGPAATPAEIETARAAVGAFALPAGSRDAALLLTLPAGGYTVQVTGKGDAEGVILLEIYEVP